MNPPSEKILVIQTELARSARQLPQFVMLSEYARPARTETSLFLDCGYPWNREMRGTRLGEILLPPVRDQNDSALDLDP
jgi:hypothetical protein